MAKEVKKEKTAPIDIKKAVSAANELLRDGMSNARYNLRLDAMQLANAKNDYTAEARVARAEKMMARIEADENKFKGAIDEATGQPLKPVSNWNPLADYFARTLAHLTEKSFTLDAGINAAKFLQNAKFQTVTVEQKAVVITFYTNKARANWDRVLFIRAILERKGLLKKAAAKLPTETEVKEMQDTVE